MYSAIRQKTTTRTQEFPSAFEKKREIFFGCKKVDRQEKKKEAKKRTDKMH